MSTSIALIRAAPLVAYVKWLEARGRPVDEYLAAVGVAGDPVSDANRSVPLRSVVTFMRDAADREGLPDLACRVVTGSSVAELGFLGRAAISGSTVAEGLWLVSQAMPDFCTHEVFDLVEHADGGTMNVRFTLDLDPATLHHAQLFTLALVASFCAAAHPRPPFFEAVVMPPHPEVGLTHLPPGIARSVWVASDEVMHVTFSAPVLQARLPRRDPAPPVATPARTPASLLEQARFLDAARMIVAAMVADGRPSAGILAAAAGITLRTLQRRLAAEGTSFTALVDEARREVALTAIASSATPLAEISVALGYASPSALTRAVRRWTDRPPRDLRRHRSRTSGPRQRT